MNQFFDAQLEVDKARADLNKAKRRKKKAQIIATATFVISVAVFLVALKMPALILLIAGMWAIITPLFLREDHGSQISAFERELARKENRLNQIANQIIKEF